MKDSKSISELNIPSRQARNMELYQEINKSNLEDVHINSNVSVLDDDGNNINLDKVKEMLQKKYDLPIEVPKKIDYNNDVMEELEFEQTREHNINALLEKAKESKTINYEVDRLKKGRTSQYDILNSLDITKTDDEELEEVDDVQDDFVATQQRVLQELIDTISINEKDLGEPIDMFEDLKSVDDTQVVPGVHDEFIKMRDPEEEIIKELENQVKKEKDVTENSYMNMSDEMTKELAFDEDDLEELDLLFDEGSGSSPIMIIGAIILIILLIVGIVFMLNGIFDWKLFA